MELLENHFDNIKDGNLSEFENDGEISYELFYNKGKKKQN